MQISSPTRITFSTPVSVSVSNFPSSFAIAGTASTIDEHVRSLHEGYGFEYYSPIISVNANSTDNNYWFWNESASAHVRITVIAILRTATLPDYGRYALYEGVTANINSLTTWCRNRTIANAAGLTVHQDAWNDGTVIYDRMWPIAKESINPCQQDEEWQIAASSKYGIYLQNDTAEELKFQFILNWQEY